MVTRPLTTGTRRSTRKAEALHSALPVAALLALYVAPGIRAHGKLLAFLLGWAGHVLADALTHAEDARPILWPLSRRRFAGPISYWDHATMPAPSRSSNMRLCW